MELNPNRVPHFDSMSNQGATVVTGNLTTTGTVTAAGVNSTGGSVQAIGTSYNIRRVGANGQYSSIQQNTTLLNMATATGTGTGTITWTGGIPAGSLVIGVTTYVKTILAGSGLTTYSVGISGTTGAFGTGIAKAAGTTSDLTATGQTNPFYKTAATDVLITAGAGVFSTGELRVTVHYITLGSATS